MPLKPELLNNIKAYVAANYVPEQRIMLSIDAKACVKTKASADYGLYDDTDKLRLRVKKNISESWQEALFSLIDSRFLDEVEVYKRGGLTKQTFSKIRSNSDYHPDKDTAIRLCIGLKLNLEDTLDLLGKAGYTLSHSIARDLVIRYFIENKEYDIYEIDIALEEMGMKQFLKY